MMGGLTGQGFDSHRDLLWIGATEPPGAGAFKPFLLRRR